MWLYINKIRVFEFVSNGSASIPCYNVYFSSAAAPGKYKIGCYVIFSAAASDKYWVPSSNMSD